MNRLCVKNLTKKLNGSTVLKSVSLEMQSQEIYGLVGKNGSGKTMLIRSIAGLMKPTEGAVTWNDSELYRDIDFIPKLGVVIENINLYPEFTGFQNLMFLAKINRICGKEDVRKAIARVGLDPDDKRIIRKYSLGMRQKIALAQAIMEKPDVLLLDEPTNALDEASTALIRGIIKEEAERGAIVLIASHNQEDIQQLCHTIYHMQDGELNVAGDTV